MAAARREPIFVSCVVAAVVHISDLELTLCRPLGTPDLNVANLKAQLHAAHTEVDRLETALREAREDDRNARLQALEGEVQALARCVGNPARHRGSSIRLDLEAARAANESMQNQLQAILQSAEDAQRTVTERVATAERALEAMRAMQVQQPVEPDRVQRAQGKLEDARPTSKQEMEDYVDRKIKTLNVHGIVGDLEKRLEEQREDKRKDDADAERTRRRALIMPSLLHAAGMLFAGLIFRWCQWCRHQRRDDWRAPHVSLPHRACNLVLIFYQGHLLLQRDGLAHL